MYGLRQLSISVDWRVLVNIRGLGLCRGLMSPDLHWTPDLLQINSVVTVWKQVLKIEKLLTDEKS